MSISQTIKTFYLSYLSKPRCDRIIYRGMKKNKTRSIVELGMGDFSRSKKIIEHAQRVSGEKKIKYTAIDLFDSRPADLPVLKLIETHRALCKTEANVKLVPGDESALAQIANSLTNTDLILISACSDIQSQTQMWFYLPRMLHARSAIFRQLTMPNGERVWNWVRASEIESLSNQDMPEAA